MATKKHSSTARKARDPFAGIPKDERETVAIMIGLATAKGQRLRPAQAWARLQEVNKRDAEKKSAEQAKFKSEHQKQALDWERRDSAQAINQLAVARDFCQKIEDGETEMGPESMAMCVRLIIEDAGKVLEQSLCNVGHIPEADGSGWGGGYFINTMKRTRQQARVAA